MQKYGYWLRGCMKRLSLTTEEETVIECEDAASDDKTEQISLCLWDFVLNEGPWAFDGNILLLRTIMGFEQPFEVQFTITPLSSLPKLYNSKKKLAFEGPHDKFALPLSQEKASPILDDMVVDDTWPLQPGTETSRCKLIDRGKSPTGEREARLISDEDLSSEAPESAEVARQLARRHEHHMP
ncbi:hypothetical protein Cgig2_014152 [Carnegiea gigantea]|uniref:Uncharacterized protein n=1 Tax=Carnegiea gigantea TaxID=171969 RepID=A0A9Q1GT75_9CARY|nr:hypothetical protein Cgig2_014152 [Carnegiea gigantea]